MISATSSSSCSTRPSPTEVLESRRHRHCAAAAVEPARAGPGHDLADGGEHRAGGLGQTVAQTREGGRLADDEQLVVFAAAGGPVDGIGVERLGHGPCGGGDRQALHVHAGAGTALGHEPSEVGGETVGEVHPRLGADVGGLRPAAAEVHVLHEKVGGGQEGRAAARLEDGAVVANAGQEAGRTPTDEPTDQPDEVVLARSVTAHGATAVLPRKLPSSRFPSTVRMDSGWNCTPSTGHRRWRTPMISPSSAHAVTSRSAGTVWGRITSEW